MAKYFVIIPCAGSGSRFGATLAKQYQPLLGKTLLDWTLRAFLGVDLIDEIIVVANPEDEYIDGYAKSYPGLRIAKVGGATRTQSVLNGLNQLACAENDWVLVHDAARCCIRPSDIQKLITTLVNTLSGGILACPAVDTVKQVANNLNHAVNLTIQKTLPRQYIYLAQTPQMFRAGVLKDALALADPLQTTDEASAVELNGKEVRVVECGTHNLKVTYPQDLAIAALILTSNQESGHRCPGVGNVINENMFSQELVSV